jgi:hypothetical protein
MPPPSSAGLGVRRARRFIKDARTILVEPRDEAPSLQTDADFRQAPALQSFADGCALGSLSMTCYGLDTEARCPTGPRRR